MAAPAIPATARSSAAPRARWSILSGYAIEPNITIPGTATSVSISADGVVEAYLNNDTNPTELGQLQLARFVNKSGSESLGDNLFTETAASGPAQWNCPIGMAPAICCRTISEMANVNSVTEIADLIAAAAPTR
ncbi:hypothetical protein N8D56_14070 [Devosia sp. A8/3-2]|nr:hypothetical protein N8D56_14070 [Devosia sp. A8/3-2]